MPNPSNGDLVEEPPIAQKHRLTAVRGPDHRPNENPWHADCSCGWRSPLMRFAGDAALLGAQHVIDSALLGRVRDAALTPDEGAEGADAGGR